MLCQHSLYRQSHLRRPTLLRGDELRRAHEVKVKLSVMDSNRCNFRTLNPFPLAATQPPTPPALNTGTVVLTSIKATILTNHLHRVRWLIDRVHKLSAPELHHGRSLPEVLVRRAHLKTRSLETKSLVPTEPTQHKEQTCDCPGVCQTRPDCRVPQLPAPPTKSGVP